MALRLKRSRRVVGMCSMDDSPRRHALQIAMLSAETVNWETFLRAHLDIMNDRFARASDGSYAWDARQTYLRELEELDINVQDLLLGITLRLENPSSNHYYGSITRVGRAMAETQKPRQVEAALMETIADDELDDFNRLLMYYVLYNYTAHLKDDSHQDECREKLQEAALSLPPYMRDKVATLQAELDE